MKNNFATMHSALTSAYMVLVKAYMDKCQIPPAELARVISILEQAVAIKPRNCDMDDAKAAEKEFIRQTGSKSIRSKSVRWLLAPYSAAENNNAKLLEGKVMK